MDHKAFVFNFDSFEQELKRILEIAIVTGEVSALTAFVHRERETLSDPCDGGPFVPQTVFERGDVNELGDVALTKYYDPTADIGLGSAWDQVQELIDGRPEFAESPILGFVIGSEERIFDPGKMGTYFQTGSDVVRNHELLERIGRIDNLETLHESIDMLSQASNIGAGLFVTF